MRACVGVCLTGNRALNGSATSTAGGALYMDGPGSAAAGPLTVTVRNSNFTRGFASVSDTHAHTHTHTHTRVLRVQGRVCLGNGTRMLLCRLCNTHTHTHTHTHAHQGFSHHPGTGLWSHVIRNSIHGCSRYRVGFALRAGPGRRPLPCNQSL